MRRRWVILGLMFAAIGPILLFVPLVPEGTPTVSYVVTGGHANFTYYRANVSGISLTGEIVIAVSWSSNTSFPVQVVAAACSASCADNFDQLTDVTNQNGTHGRFTLDQPNGGSIAMGILSTEQGSAASVTFTVTATLSTVGSALVIGWILLVAIGVIRRPIPRAETSAPSWEAPPPGVNDGPRNP